MREIKVTEFRNHLPNYLTAVNKGEEIWLTSRGEVIARLLPPTDIKSSSKKQLIQLRKHCKIGDVVSSTGMHWNAEDDHS